MAKIKLIWTILWILRSITQYIWLIKKFHIKIVSHLVAIWSNEAALSPLSTVHTRPGCVDRPCLPHPVRNWTNRPPFSSSAATTRVSVSGHSLVSRWSVDGQSWSRHLCVDHVCQITLPLTDRASGGLWPEMDVRFASKSSQIGHKWDKSWKI